MLIEDLIPNPDARERHQTTIRASPEVVYESLWQLDFSRMWSARLLLALRALPGRLTRRDRRQRPSRRFDLQSLEKAGFGKLAEAPGREVVFGVTGRFWRPLGNISPFEATDFDNPVAPGLARAVWNFMVSSVDDETTVLATETRIICGDAASRMKFRIYWIVVRPFSGFIRRVILRSVKTSCEGVKVASESNEQR